MGTSKAHWFVYMVRCRDNTLYTGITTDISKRISQHNEGKGAKYTAGRRPVDLIFQERCKTRSIALRREAAIKRMTRAQKLALGSPKRLG
jgi:putative endonuclease